MGHRSTKSEAEIQADEAIDTFDELVRQRDELRAENERLGIDMRAWKILAESAEVDIERLRAALEQISRESGQVCPDFETCSHGPCQGSLAGKLLALEALATPASGQ